MKDTEGRRAVSLATGNGGWVCYRASDLAEPIFVRVAEAGDGRLEVVDVFLQFDSGATARAMRDLAARVSAVERWVNEPAQAEAARARLKTPGPDLRTAATYYAVNPGTEPQKGWTWPERMLLAQRKDSDEPRAPRKRPPTLRDPDEPPDLELDVPTTRPHPDAFYAQVARAYTSAARESARPAAWIADVNDVPVKTVQRWVGEARKRGHLPRQGHRGKAV